MRRKLTITIADEVYRGLHQQVGRGEISRFIENLVRPCVVGDSALEQEYREAALDEEAEREALEWIEGTVGDALDDDDAW
ncbi:MAG TPA: addiction module antitoxin [Chloroflexota bacterium]|nr:addiction module antitoxin [Chloroflexota bacterium]